MRRSPIVKKKPISSSLMSSNRKTEIFALKRTSTLREIRLLFSLGAPLILAQMIQTSMGFVDTIMTGHFSAVDLAAVAVGEKSMIAIIFVGVGLISALQVLVARLHGADAEPGTIGLQVVQGIWVGQIYGILAWVIVRNMLPFMTFLQIEPRVFDLAQEYMKAFSWGLPATFLFASLRGYYEGSSISRLTFYFCLIGLVVNIVGNYTLIFGNFGAPRLGAVGAGWSSTMANWVMVGGLLIYSLVNKKVAKCQIFSRLGKVSWQGIQPIMRIGAPIGISIFIEVSIFVIFSLLMVRFGIEVLAANQIAINYLGFIYMVPLGLGMASTTRVGIALGRNNLRQARLIGVLSIGFGGCLMLVSSIILILFSQQIAGMFTNDAALLVIAAKFLVLGAFFQIPDGFQATSVGVLRGWKDTRVTMIIIFISFWVIGLGSGYYLAFVLEYGPEGLWYGLILGLSVQAVLLCGRLYHISHRRLLHLKNPSN